MNINAEKIELAQLIFSIENKITIKKIKNLLKAEEPDLWDELHDDVKLAVDESIKQLDAGKGVPHNLAIKKLSRWVKK